MTPAKRPGRWDSGLTLIEVVIAMALMALVMLAVSQGLSVLSRLTHKTKDRAYAVQKAIQMMEELRSHVANSGGAVSSLDDFDDGTSYNFVLTTFPEVTDPGDPLSGNGKRVYKRRITVLAVPNEPLARRVYVRVYDADSGEALAETVSVLRTVESSYVPSQVFDIYILALENVPGWWVALSQLKPMFDNILQDLQTRDPGMEIRTHWITRQAYGRDPYYAPYINQSVKTESAAPPWVYLYPGFTTKEGEDFYYYVPGFFASRMNVDGTITNPASYSLADQYNQGVRAPKERELYDAAVAAAQSAGTSEPEMSYAMLLAELNDASLPLRNALVINLHGELVPLPPLRNYSDAAKDPSGIPDVRAVSHPERLEYSSGDAVKLRAYSYVMDPDDWAGSYALSTMTVLLPGDSVSSSDISVRKLAGNDTVPYQWQDAVEGTDYTVTNPGGGTLITLSSSPLRAPTNSAATPPSGGLVSGLKYEFYDIDSSMSNLPDFSTLTPDELGVCSDFDISVRPSGEDDEFAMRFTGLLNAPADGNYSFRLDSDDGSRLYIDGVLRVDSDFLQGMGSWSTSSTFALTAGTHSIVVEHFENSGGQGLDVEWERDLGGYTDILGSDLFRVDELYEGVAWSYYDGSFGSADDLAPLTPDRAGASGRLSEWPRYADSGNFGIAFDGYLDVPSAGDYTFYLTSDDGSKLYVDGGLVVNNDGQNPGSHSGTAYGLSAGTHAFRVDYFHRTGTENLLAEWSGPFARVEISSSSLRFNPSGSGAKGLPSGERLYGLEYIPCLVDGSAFSEGVRDLTTGSASRPKNTARWVVTFAAGALSDGVHEFETRIGPDTTTGPGNKPEDLSETYAWVGQSAPITERYQFMGDPRHMPYADVKDDEGYNWYFRSVDSGDWPGFGKATDGWGTGGSRLNYDLPRYMLALRGGLIDSEAIFNSITGWAFYYFGVGGEFGADSSNGFPDSLQIRETPWNPNSSTVRGIQEITDANYHPHKRVISDTADTWWGAYWLGELYPDSEFSTWQANGNLPVGPGNFYRARFEDKGFPDDFQARSSVKGCSSFFNGNSGSGYYNHDSNSGNTADITSSGTAVAQDFNFPLLSSMQAARPFRLNHTSSDRKPTEWDDPVYSALRTSLSTLETIYDATQSGDHDSSAVVRIEQGGKAANAVMNGLSPQTSFGSAQIGKLCVLTMLRAFLSAGGPGVSVSRIPQVPLVSISSPTVTQEFIDPSSISVDWDLDWTRWDGEPYTDSYGTGWVGVSTMTYNVKYSNNNGRDWHFADDGADADDGTYDVSHSTTAPFTWDVSGLARGTYLVRVEGYRDDRQLHYTYHQRQVYIQR